MNGGRALRRTGTIGSIAGLVGLGLAGPAQAAPPTKPLACGAVITANTTLTANLGPCRSGGLTIGASGITLNLGGFTVFGGDRPGDDAGVRFDNVSGSTVTNGTVQAFDAGVYIVGGGSNTVTGVTARNNVGSGKVALGEGIAVQDSSNNVITANTVSGNGPFGGITLVNEAADATQNSDANQITNNTVSNNNNQSGNINQMQVDGIRIEGPGATNTVISGNQVTGSGLDGIAVFANQGSGRKNSGTQILNNTVTGNGAHQEVHRKGDGIILFGAQSNPTVGADNTLVQGNTVTGNAANGIRSNSANNTITGNTATGNAAVTTTAFDLADGWTPCGSTWSNNTFGTANQACIS